MKDNYISEKQTELFNELGVFFAFNKQQFNEGYKEAKVDKPVKYVSFGGGAYCPKPNVQALRDGLAEIKANWTKERQKVEQVRLTFVGVDDWNRPVWKAPDHKAYYGSVNELFNWEATEDEVLKKVDTYGLCYFGDHFGCEPMGSSVSDKYFI
jgi:hypothetical protein